MAFTTSKTLVLLSLISLLAPAKSAPTGLFGLALRADNSTDFQKQNGLDAQKLNAQFATMKASDPCTAGQQACINSAFAQCVGTTWQLTTCTANTTCIALPLVNSPGTSLVCDMQSDAIARMEAAGVGGSITGSGNSTVNGNGSNNSTDTNGQGDGDDSDCSDDQDGQSDGEDGSDNGDCSGDDGDDSDTDSQSATASSSSAFSSSSASSAAAPATVTVTVTAAGSTASSSSPLVSSSSASVTFSSPAIAAVETQPPVQAQSSAASTIFLNSPTLSASSSGSAASATSSIIILNRLKRQLQFGTTSPVASTIPTTGLGLSTSAPSSTAIPSSTVAAPFGSSPAGSLPVQATSSSVAGAVTVTVVSTIFVTETLGAITSSADIASSTELPGFPSTPLAQTSSGSIVASSTFLGANGASSIPPASTILLNPAGTSVSVAIGGLSSAFGSFDSASASPSSALATPTPASGFVFTSAVSSAPAVTATPATGGVLPTDSADIAELLTATLA